MEERKTVYSLLMCASGMMGAYTYVLRGGVFCNAQTGNMLMMGLALGKGEWAHAAYYLIPMLAYFLGAYASELLRSRWESWSRTLAALELCALGVIGFLPASVPDQIVQVAVNFLCSMQYNTYRQARGIPMSTTFCTNHVRQLGIWMAQYHKDHTADDLKRVLVHITMLASFVMGAAIVTGLAESLQTSAIWVAMIPLAGVFLLLQVADLKKQRALQQ